MFSNTLFNSSKASSAELPNCLTYYLKVQYNNSDFQYLLGDLNQYLFSHFKKSFNFLVHLNDYLILVIIYEGA